MSARSSLREICKKQLNSLRSEGLFKNERLIQSRQEAVIKVQGHKQETLNFCANNYLGLAVSYFD